MLDEVAKNDRLEMTSYYSPRVEEVVTQKTYILYKWNGAAKRKSSYINIFFQFKTPNEFEQSYYFYLIPSNVTGSAFQNKKSSSFGAAVHNNLSWNLLKNFIRKLKFILDYRELSILFHDFLYMLCDVGFRNSFLKLSQFCFWLRFSRFIFLLFFTFSSPGISGFGMSNFSCSLFLFHQHYFHNVLVFLVLFLREQIPNVSLHRVFFCIIS